VALLNPDRLKATLGHGLTALVEVSLDKQGSEHMDAFEARAVALDAVQQCWRVSPGPDFMLVVQARDMPHYLSLSQALFTQDANVRNVKAFLPPSGPNSQPLGLCCSRLKVPTPQGLVERK
jgi:DNA-binding Lrp family transcriptional regulator